MSLSAVNVSSRVIVSQKKNCEEQHGRFVTVPFLSAFAHIVIGLHLKASAIGAGVLGRAFVVNADSDFFQRAEVLFVIVMFAAGNRAGDALIGVFVVHDFTSYFF